MEEQERLKEGESFIIAREWDKAETAFLEVLGGQPDNVDALNNLGTLKYLTKQRQKAEEYFLKALGIDSKHKPTLMNLGILYQAEKEWEKAESAFVKYLEFNGDDQNVLNRLKQIRMAAEKESVTHALTEGINKNKNSVNAPDVDKTAFQNAGVEPSSKGRKSKISILCSPGLEAFLTDIVRLLDGPYQVRTCYSNNMHELSTAVEWADVVWLEWANELAVHLTNKLPMLAHKKVICRAHRYELFTQFFKQIRWEYVDKLLFVAEFMQDYATKIVPDIEQRTSAGVLYNGVDLKKFEFKERVAGFNLAVIGYIHGRKNPYFWPQIMSQLKKLDDRYTLHIAGKFQDSVCELYLRHMVDKLNLKNNIIFHGWQPDIHNWLEDKNYLLTTSVHESFGYTIAEAMAMGIRPIVHWFPGAEELWPKECLYTTIEEAVTMVQESEQYNSVEYRNFVEERYGLDMQMTTICTLIGELLQAPKYVPTVGNIDPIQSSSLYKPFIGNNNKEVEDLYNESYEIKNGYYFTKNENKQFFMNPWKEFNSIKDNCPHEVILQQIQNQLKYIIEIYFNGSNNPSDYYLYYNYLLELLQASSLCYIRPIQEMLTTHNKDTNISLPLIEATLLELYPIFKEQIDNLTKVKPRTHIIQDFYLDKNFNHKDNLVRLTYKKLASTLLSAQDYIKSFFIHGSLSTLDYTSYSDVDSLIILKDNIFSSMGNLRRCRNTIKRATVHLFEYDPIQHHGFFIITELDMDYYPQSYLPVELLKYSTLVLGERKLVFNLRPCAIENLYALWSMAYSIRVSHIAKKYPKDKFSLKRYMSRLMLMPTLYLQLSKAIFPYKRDSFLLAKESFSKKAWRAIEYATKLREDWAVDKKIQMNHTFYSHSAMFADECINKLFSCASSNNHFDHFR